MSPIRMIKKIRVLLGMGMLMLFFLNSAYSQEDSTVPEKPKAKPVKNMFESVWLIDNQTVFVPNGALSNGTIINYSMQGERRADLTFAVSYDSDIKKAKEVLLDVLNKNPKVLKKPAPEVFVKNLTASAVEFSVRPWAKNVNYGVVFSETLENCKTALDEAGISVQPYTLQK